MIIRVLCWFAFFIALIWFVAIKPHGDEPDPYREHVCPLLADGSSDTACEEKFAEQVSRYFESFSHAEDKR